MAVRTNHKRLSQQLKAMQEGLIKRPDFSDSISIPEFISKIKIIDEDGQLLPLILYEEQEQVLDQIMRARADGRIPRFIIYKSRRLGMSTLIQAYMYARAVLEPPTFTATVAHDWETVRDVLFPMCRIFNEHLPEDYRRPLKYETQSLFEWDAPYHSRMRLGTANNKKLFRGGAALLVHFSEFAMYEDPLTPYSAATATCPKNPNSLMVIESTPQPEGLFKQIWDGANNGDNDFTPIFFSCKGPSKYRMKLFPGEDLRLTEEWVDYKREYALDDEQTKYLHYVWKNDYSCDWDMYNQEFPITPEVGFISSGQPFFNLHILKKWQEDYICDPIFRGLLKYDKPQIIIPDALPGESNPVPIVSVEENDYGPLRIWEYPQHDYFYLIIADVAEGVKQDWSIGHAIKVPRHLDEMPEQVAEYASNNIDAYWFGLDLYLYGLYFNEGLIAVERNSPGMRTLAALERGDLDAIGFDEAYPNLYEELRYVKREKEPTKRMGFRTDGTTKPMIMETLRQHINQESIIIHSRALLEELKGCQRDYEKRKFIQKHKNPVSNLYNDDRLIALAIGCQVLEDVQVRSFFRKVSTQ